MKKTYVFILLGCLYILQLKAQNPEWLHYYKIDWVGKTVQSGENLWMIANIGLVKYNGETGQYSFYNTTNCSLPTNYIEDINIDHENNLWVMCYGGNHVHDHLVKYDQQNSWQVYNASNTLLPQDLLGFDIDKNDNIWVVTDSGFYSYNHTSWKAFHSTGNYTDADIFDYVKCGQDGKLYLSNNGLTLFNPANSNFTHYDANALKIPNSYNCMTFDYNGSLWMGYLHGVERFSSGHFYAYTEQNYNYVSNIRSIAMDASNNLWMTSTDIVNGVIEYEYEHSSFKTIFFGNQITHSINNKNSVFVDQKGAIWCSEIGGLYKIENSAWTKIPIVKDSLPSNYVTGISFDQLQNPYFNCGPANQFGEITIAELQKGKWQYCTGDYSGLTAINKKNMLFVRSHYDSVEVFNNNTHYPILSPVTATYSSPDPHIFMFDNDDHLWASYIDTSYQFTEPWGEQVNISLEGLTRYDGSKWIKFNNNNSPINGNDLLCAAADYQHNLWLAEDFNLWKIDSELHFSTISSPSYISFIHTMAVDKNNNLWIPTNKLGLQKYDGSGWTNYTPLDSSPYQNTFNYVAADIDNKIWCSQYLYSGITCFDGIKYINFNYSNSPFPSSEIQVNGISVDGVGNKYIISNEGVYVYRKDGVKLNYNPYPYSFNDSNVVHVFPNPSSSNFKLSYKLSASTSVQFQVISLLGQIVYSTAVQEEAPGIYYQSVDLSSYANGLYLLRTLFNNQPTITRLVKQR